MQLENSFNDTDCCENDKAAIDRNGDAEMSNSSIAVIIPTFNEVDVISALLDQLVKDSYDVIAVVDSASTDGTVGIVEQYPGVRLISVPRGRGIAMQRGVCETESDYIFLLHADSTLPADASEIIRTTLADPAIAGGCFRLRFDRDSSILRLYAWFSRFDSAITTFGDQGYFMRRASLEVAGGVPNFPILEDVELRRRLRSQGEFVKVSREIVTSARRFEKTGVIFGQCRNAILIAAYYLGFTPAWLSRFYPPNCE